MERPDHLPKKCAVYNVRNISAAPYIYIYIYIYKGSGNDNVTVLCSYVLNVKSIIQKYNVQNNIRLIKK